ncbi:MAG: flavodoxin family protein [Elusimicrobiaceae bacterium]|nr:flavodoxin family protein [Elusimicrobiaceae bacterium]
MPAKKVLIISSGPRKNGNTDLLCSQFQKGAKEAGHKAEKIFLPNYKINYCSGCGACRESHTCVQKDDMAKLLDKMVKADVIVLGTPVYFYSMCAQLKTFIDRCVARYTEISGKDFYFILAAADTSKKNMTRTIEALRGFTEDCLENTREKAIIYGVGAWEKGEVKDLPVFEKAYEAGKKC